MRKPMLVFMLTFLLMTASVIAANQNVEIGNVSAYNKVVMFEVVNNSEEDVTLTMTILKDEELDILEDRVYFFTQQTISAHSSERFEIYIPDLKKGYVRGSGTYTISVLNAEDELIITKSFEYADITEIDEFVQDLKDAAEEVADENNAYQKLLPIFEREDNSDVLFSIGIDRQNFMQEPEKLRSELMNLIYSNGLSEIKDADELADMFMGFYSLAIYNSGEKRRAMEIIKPEYGDEVIDDVLNKALEIMDDKIDSPENLIKNFAVAYGIASVGSSSVNQMEEALKKFSSITGECKSVISKINSLSSSRKYKVYEKIVTSCNNKLPETPESLKKILDNAYKSVEQNTSSGGNTPGGGSGGGSTGAALPSFASGNDGSGQNVDISGDKYQEPQKYVFTDMTKEHWAAEAVSYLSDIGVVNGTESNNFEPERFIKREEFAKMLTVVCGFSEILPSDMNFADVKIGEWYSGYIGAAMKNGIAKGKSPELFGIGENISRQDMAVMVSRALKAMNIEHEKQSDYIPFNDEEKIDEYAIANVIELFESGIINGKGNNSFDPLGYSTRAEAAKIIYEAFKGGE